ncbi:MAG TPA: helix-turn-helix domain-containing protein [Marmoricola sp.]|nr:helix-turn-helix domain-containing protein [Marmoricola sp.]
MTLREDLSMARQGPKLPAEVRLTAVLSVLSGELSIQDAARRHRVAPMTIQKWRDRFLEAGRDALANDRLSGPVTGESVTEQRMRLENEQLKLALAEATVQLRIWQKGAEHVDQVPSKTSRR